VINAPPIKPQYPISISQLCLENTDVPAGVGAPPLDTMTAAESAQQREAWLARQRVRDRTHRFSQSAERLACETPSNNPH